MPRWLRLVVDLLLGLGARGRLEEASADPESLRILGTTTTDLPTLGGRQGPPGGLRESRDLAHAHPELVRRYLRLKEAFARRTGRCLFETCTYRSKERQGELHRIGRRGVAGEKVVTMIDGVTRKSRHQVYPSQAVDVCVDADPGPGKHPVWDPKAYESLGELALEHGLIWGGDWNGNGRSDDERFVDYPHLELPAGAA